MKPAASGRILFWRHGSLWIGLAGEPAQSHCHHAVQISLPFPGCHVRLQRPSGNWATFNAVIVTANVPHAFEAREQHVAQLFLDPESRAGRALNQCYQDKGIDALNVSDLAPWVAKLAAAYHQQAEDEELIRLADAVIETMVGAANTSATLPDPRIVRAIKLMRERLSRSVSLGSIATAVHLSPDRFRHLFMEETGVAFRAYLLWLRLEVALSTYVGGSSLTDAAYAGGFADSAHFSRTFRKMFGIAPASVRPE